MVWFSVFNMPVTSSMNMIRNVEKSKIYSERRVSSDILRVFLLSVYFFLFDIQLVLMDILAQTVPDCKPDTCRHTDGECSCSAGWTGYNCTTGKSLTSSIVIKTTVEDKYRFDSINTTTFKT